MTDAPLLGPASQLDAPGLYLTGEDNLRLTTFGGLAGAIVSLEGRLIDRAGRLVPIVEVQTPNSNYTAKTSIVQLAEGVLTNVQLRASTGTAVRGISSRSSKSSAAAKAACSRSARCSRGM
jgi:hypothetical protein